MENRNLRLKAFQPESKIYDKLKVFPIIISPNSRNNNMMIRPTKTAYQRAFENTQATTTDFASKLLKDKIKLPKRYLKDGTASQLNSLRVQSFNIPQFRPKDLNKNIIAPANLSLNTPTGMINPSNYQTSNNQKLTPKNSSGVLLNVSYYDDILQKYQILNKSVKKKNLPSITNSLQAKLNFRIREIRKKDEEVQHDDAKKRRLKLVNPRDEFKRDLTNISRQQVSSDQVVNGHDERNIFDIINEIDIKENHHTTYQNHGTSKDLHRINTICTKDFKYAQKEESSNNSQVIDIKHTGKEAQQKELQNLNGVSHNTNKNEDSLYIHTAEPSNKKKHHSDNSSSFVMLSSSSGQHTRQIKFTYKKKRLLCCF